MLLVCSLLKGQIHGKQYLNAFMFGQIRYSHWIQHELSCLILRCWLSWVLHYPLVSNPLSLDMFLSVRVQGADWPAWHSGKEKGGKPLTFCLVTSPAQPIFSHPQLSSFLYLCLWIVFETKLKLWLDISSGWESWEQIIIILTSGLFSCAVRYSKHFTWMNFLNSYNSLYNKHSY